MVQEWFHVYFALGKITSESLRRTADVGDKGRLTMRYRSTKRFLFQVTIVLRITRRDTTYLPPRKASPRRPTQDQRRAGKAGRHRLPQVLASMTTHETVDPCVSAAGQEKNHDEDYQER